MTFDEVVFALKTNHVGESFIGVFFRLEDKYFGFYEISSDSEDPELISIQFEGGVLFSHDGEEDFYSLDDAPDQAKILNYVNSITLPYIGGYVSEHAIFRLYPDLPDPDDIWSDSDRFDFIKSVTEKFITKK